MWVNRTSIGTGVDLRFIRRGRGWDGRLCIGIGRLRSRSPATVSRHAPLNGAGAIAGAIGECWPVMRRRRGSDRRDGQRRGQGAGLRWWWWLFRRGFSHGTVTGKFHGCRVLASNHLMILLLHRHGWEDFVLSFYCRKGGFSSSPRGL